MTDDRPRPQYGEYATPEQQAAAMGRTGVPSSAQTPAPEPRPDFSQSRPYAQQHEAQQRTGTYAGRVITIFLLVVGGLNLATTVPTDLDLSKAMHDASSLYGSSLPSLPSSINGAGIPVLIANIVLYALTVLWAVWAIRKGRPSVHIPIVGFLVFALVVCVLLVLYAPGYFHGLSS